MRKFFTLFLPLCTLGLLGLSQPIFTDRFDYGSSSGNIVGLGSSPWLQTGNISTNPIQYDNSSSLSFPGHPSTGGKLAIAAAGGQDIVAALPNSISSNTLYFSVLAKFSSVQGVGDYFIHFTQAVGVSTFTGRVFVRPSDNNNPSNIQFGLLKNSGGATPYASQNFDLDTTYCIVLKYTFVDGGTTNDIADLYVFKAASGVPISEPGSSLLQATANTDATAGIAAISIRQGGATATPAGTLDNVIVATSWNDFTSALPVNLLSFTASKTNRSQLVNWVVTGEKSGYTYDVERSDDGVNFRQVGTMIARGNGQRTAYSFEDKNQATGTVYYRLKMNEAGGAVKYSRTLSLSPARSGKFLIFPNPLATGNQLAITHSAISKANSLTMYDNNGRQMMRLVLPEGSVQTSLNTSHMAAGIYRLVLDNNGQRSTTTLIKQ